MPSTYTLGGLTFNSGAADGSGNTWFGNLAGWATADLNVAADPRETEHGSDFIAGFYPGRTITLTGTVMAASPTALKTARDALVAALGSITALELLVVNDPTPMQAYVFQQSRLQWSEIDNYLGEFSVGLYAPDPRRYATSTTSTALSAGLATPSPSVSASATGGSLVAGVYAYRVSAVNGTGETQASSELLAVLSALTTPGQPSLTTGSTGTLANVGTQAYRVSAVNAIGETLASTEAVIAHGGSAGSSTSITVAWAPVAGATGYNVYGRTAGSELKLTATPVTGTSFVDTGAVTPSGALPSSNTTATTTGSVVLAWSAVAGATGYNVYGRTVSGELKMTPSPISALTFTDTGSVTPSGALPSGGFTTTVTNSGTHEAGTEPVLTVVGPAAGPITLSRGTPAKTVTISTALASGETLTVDLSAGVRSISINGISRLDLQGPTEWWALAPGANLVSYAGGGTANLVHRNAW